MVTGRSRALTESRLQAPSLLRTTSDQGRCARVWIPSHAQGTSKAQTRRPSPWRCDLGPSRLPRQTRMRSPRVLPQRAQGATRPRRTRHLASLSPDRHGTAAPLRRNRPATARTVRGRDGAGATPCEPTTATVERTCSLLWLACPLGSWPPPCLPGSPLQEESTSTIETKVAQIRISHPVRRGVRMARVMLTGATANSTSPCGDLTK